MKLLKIVSGGQTGADQAGLRAAKDFGIPTGGWLPKDCLTLEGLRPDLLMLYDMKEHVGGYAQRTEANVQDSDGTLRFARDFKSAGEKCTLKAIKWFYRPYFDIHVDKAKPVEEVLTWLAENNIQILNIAGNSEETTPKIGEFVYQYLTELFQRLKCLS